MAKLIALPQKAIVVIRLRGISYLGYLIFNHVCPGTAYTLLRKISPGRLTCGLQFAFVSFMLLSILSGSIVKEFVVSVGFLTLALLSAGVLLLLRYPKPDVLLHDIYGISLPKLQSPFTLWKEWHVDFSVRQKVDEYRKKHPGAEIVLGNVDTDGRLLEKFGPLPGWSSISESAFVPRHRFPLDVVLVDDYVLIRKNFRGNRRLFIQEWNNLVLLTGKANVPAVYRVNEKDTLLYKSLLVARTVRDILVENGANILNAQTDSDSDLAGLNKTERLQTILKRGTERLPGCLSESFFTRLEDQIDAIHQEGIAGLSLTFGNVMVDNQDIPWLIDFEGSISYQSVHHPFFQWQRDQDRQKYNLIYNRQLLTEERIRQSLDSQHKKLGQWYAPIDFGKGLTVGGFWTVDSGTGRWEYLNGKVMSQFLVGKRVLDLGSNNGVMPLMMLRAGACEVIGLEISPEFVESARLVHKIFEWRDMRHYKFSIYQANMLDILNMDWGKFDVITSLCTLYYLSLTEMTAVIRRAAELAPVFIVQANDHTRPSAADGKAEKSSLSYLKRAMEENGFPNVEIHAPQGYSRPLLIGRKWTIKND